ncbi:MAG: hypothetical protein EOO07_16035 [Chitinophagaceae bacterium]|nr:MAG: hypothetical protein EOO07_16035 [Chitinophagaceae bacterium]
MKQKIYILFSIFPCFVWSQSAPEITVLTDTHVVGVGVPNATLHIKPTTNVAVIDNTIPSTGVIEFNLSGLSAGTDAVIWQTVNGMDSQKIVVPILTANQIIANRLNPTSPTTAAQAKYKETLQLMADDLLMKSTIATYKRTIVTTNFTIPVARFDINKPQYDDSGNLIGDSKGSISLFTSFGFGVGICGGRSEITRDSNGVIIDDSFSNTLGIYLGLLYQASTGENLRNVFAPTLSLSILDIQVGVGYDYGKVPTTQERYFVTVSYGIPLYKLFRSNHRVWLDDIKSPIAVKRI